MDIVINADIISIPDGAIQIPQQANFYHNILNCLNTPITCFKQTVPNKDEAFPPPIATLLSRYHGLEGDWLIMSPLHWEATHNDAMITASGHELQLSNQESQQWFKILNDFLTPLDYSLYYHDAYTWLIQCADHPTVTAKPIHNLLHHSIMPELKNLDDTLFWQQFITETQMFLGSHPLNKARKGLPSINGVWVWGGGPLPAPGQTPLVCYHSNLVQLGTLLSTQVIDEPLPLKSANHSVLLFNELSEADRLLLQDQLQSYNVRWYWNNLAYLTKQKRWWSRIIGII